MLIIDLPIAIILPAIIFLFPGILFFRQNPRTIKQALTALSLALLTSTVFHLLVSVTLATLHLPVTFPLFIALAISLPFFQSYSRHILPALKLLHPLPALLLSLFILLSLPFIFFHQGLPTGDIQKSIFWAGKIIETGGLPPYQISPALFNRDPVDFYTPALHSYTAQVISLAPNPFLALGFTVIYAGLAAAVIGAAIAANISRRNIRLVSSLTLLFIITQFRFLRYLREPGYHYQNLFGEILLFGLFFLLLLIIRRARLPYFFLTFFTIGALLLTHQFTSFLTALVILPPAIIVAWYYREILIKAFRRHSRYLFIAIISLLTFIAVLIQLNLHQKLSHFFTATPHLLPLTPDLADYPNLMGLGFIIAGITALIFLAVSSKNLTKNLQTRRLAFLSFAIALFVMSQAPRFNLDIPPVRALFYSAIPLSISIALLLTHAFRHTLNSYPQNRKALLTILIVFIVLMTGSGASRAFNLSHIVRTNSTLRTDYLPAIELLSGSPDSSAILVDDFLRRSASWFILTNRPVYSRLSSNLSRAMEESKQSETRYNLYLRQLDYEKIFLLGSRGISSPLLSKHNIGYLAADNATASALAEHPNLEEAFVASDLTIFKHAKNTPPQNLTPEDQWLLSASTLLNNIGDSDDTARHNPASLPATRLSPFNSDKPATIRESTAPLIPLTFNPGTYTSALWDQDSSGYSDSSLLIHLEIDSSAPLSLATPAGTLHPLKNGLNRLTINPRDVPLVDRELITFFIINDESSSVKIDLIALGLSPVP